MTGRIGAAVLARLGVDASADAPRAAQVGGAVCVAPLFATSPAVGLVALSVAVGLPVLTQRRRRSEAERAVLAELPEVIDLLAVAVAGGFTVALAIDEVVVRVPGRVARELGACRSRARLGVRLADELSDLPDRLGPPVRPLIRALVAAERHGVPIVPALVAVADDVRLARRRQAEERARRLPVVMLFPLVTCVLPAFAIVTVIPMVVTSFANLAW